MEALLPLEVGPPSFRYSTFEEKANEDGLRVNLELLDEVRDNSVQRMETYKAKTRDYFSKNVRIKNFQIGDLVMRDTSAS